jgi:hypothetical protein
MQVKTVFFVLSFTPTLFYVRAEVVKMVKKSRQGRAGKRGQEKKKTTPGSNEGLYAEEGMERNMPGAKDEQGKTRRREGKEICLVQKNCVERAGLGEGRARGGEQEMGRSVILVQMAERGLEQQQS